jgi:hypothetical protein
MRDSVESGYVLGAPDRNIRGGPNDATPPGATPGVLPGVFTGHAAPHVSGVDAATVCDVFVVMVVVPLNAVTIELATRVPPAIEHPMHGGIAGVAVSVIVVVVPLPTPDPCDE